MERRRATKFDRRGQTACAFERHLKLVAEAGADLRALRLPYFGAAANLLSALAYYRSWRTLPRK
jgi:hypothetical protein